VSKSQREVSLSMEHAQEMLEVAAHNIADGFYGSAINRAYYAIFYAANALLATQALARGKHSGVVAAFRGTSSNRALLRSSTAASMVE